MTRRRIASILAMLVGGVSASLIALAVVGREAPTVATGHVWIAPLSDGRLAIVEGRDQPDLKWLGIRVRHAQRRDRLHVVDASLGAVVNATWSENGFAIECSAAHHRSELIVHVSKENLPASGLYRRDVTTGRESLFHPVWQLEAAAYSAGDEYLAATDPSVSGHTVIVLRRGGTPLARYQLEGRRAWTWLHSQCTLAVNSTPYGVDLIDVPSGWSRRISIFAGDPTQTCYHLMSSPDDRQLAVLLGGNLGSLYKFEAPYMLAIFDLTTGRLLRQLPAVSCGYEGGLDWSAAGLCYVAPVADPRQGQLMLDRDGMPAVLIEVPRRYLQVRWLDARRIVSIDDCSGPPGGVKRKVRIHEPDSAGAWHTRTVFEAP